MHYERKTPRKTSTLNVSLPIELVESVRDLSHDSRHTISSIVRFALDAYLNLLHKKPKMGDKLTRGGLKKC